MKFLRRFSIVISILLVLLILFVCSVGLLLSDKNISGFTGLLGIMRLRKGEIYTELTENPVQILIKVNDAKGSFEDAYFDSWLDTGHPVRGYGIKDNQEYEYALRSFTRHYFIVTLEKWERNEPFPLTS